MRGCCLLCRVEGGKPFDYSPRSYARRQSQIKAKANAIRACEADRRLWIARYTAYFTCYLPQIVCGRADLEVEGEYTNNRKSIEYRYRDMIMPLYYGVFYQSGPRVFIKKYFPRSFRDVDDYIRWLGESINLAGTFYIQAIRVVEVLLGEFS